MMCCLFPLGQTACVQHPWLCIAPKLHPLCTELVKPFDTFFVEGCPEDPTLQSLASCRGGHNGAQRGRLKRSARAVQLFWRLAVVETHNLWYFGHHSCLKAGFDALGIWRFWIFTLIHSFLLFCTPFFAHFRHTTTHFSQIQTLRCILVYPH